MKWIKIIALLVFIRISGVFYIGRVSVSNFTEDRNKLKVWWWKRKRLSLRKLPSSAALSTLVLRDLSLNNTIHLSNCSLNPHLTPELVCLLGSFGSLFRKASLPIGRCLAYLWGFLWRVSLRTQSLKILTLMGAINRPFYVKGHFLNTDSGGCVQFWQGCHSGSALVAGPACTWLPCWAVQGTTAP